jgi:hypothetical protein
LYFVTRKLSVSLCVFITPLRRGANYQMIFLENTRRELLIRQINQCFYKDNDTLTNNQEE